MLKKFMNKSTFTSAKIHNVIGLIFLGIVAIILASFFAWQQIVLQKPVSDYADEQEPSHIITESLKSDLGKIQAKIVRLEDSQTSLGLKVVEDVVIQRRLNSIRNNIVNNIKIARDRLYKLNTDTDRWQLTVDAQNNTRILAGQNLVATRLSSNSTSTLPAASASISSGYFKIPILLYHSTPSDFDTQMKQLLAKGYTAIDLDQLSSAIRSHTTLPFKPVVITFDDGFANQMDAFDILSKYHLKATYYIITGGEASKFCIGANRHAGLPCGDAYLSWDQIRKLDQSGIITIGAHTVDHSNLPSLSLSLQQFEINHSKAEIEQQIGHTVHHFAYPYGSYNASTVDLVRQAGFSTAVTTLPGTLQTNSILYTLHRMRSVSALP